MHYKTVSCYYVVRTIAAVRARYAPCRHLAIRWAAPLGPRLHDMNTPNDKLSTSDTLKQLVGRVCVCSCVCGLCSAFSTMIKLVLLRCRIVFPLTEASTSKRCGLIQTILKRSGDHCLEVLHGREKDRYGMEKVENSSKALC